MIEQMFKNRVFQMQLKGCMVGSELPVYKKNERVDKHLKTCLNCDKVSCKKGDCELMRKKGMTRERSNDVVNEEDKEKSGTCVL